MKRRMEKRERERARVGDRLGREKRYDEGGTEQEKERKDRGGEEGKEE